MGLLSQAAAKMTLDDTPITLDNGVTGSAWQVATANPKNFHEAISEPGHAPAARIWAQTFLPAERKTPPAVIVVPGSLGVAPSHIYKAELLTNAGIAACVIDPFGARGVTSTVANQAQYSFAASAWDVLSAVDQLVEQGNVDAERIGAQGHSRGGSAILSAACMARLTRPKGVLCGAYAAYPWCGQQFARPDIGRTCVRSVIGDQDEWCLPQQVQGYMHAMRLCGGDATCRIFPGAHHSFDRETPVELVADASVAPGAPTIYIEDNGAYVDPVTNDADPWLRGSRCPHRLLGRTGEGVPRRHDGLLAGDFGRGTQHVNCVPASQASAIRLMPGINLHG
jgi:dienelactone hydrolase